MDKLKVIWYESDMRALLHAARTVTFGRLDQYSITISTEEATTNLLKYTMVTDRLTSPEVALNPGVRFSMVSQILQSCDQAWHRTTGRADAARKYMYCRLHGGDVLPALDVSSDNMHGISAPARLASLYLCECRSCQEQMVDIAPVECLCHTTQARQPMLMLGPRLLLVSWILYMWNVEAGLT